MSKMAMTIHQFCQFERGELTLEQIRKSNELEAIAKHIRSNKRLEKMFTFVMGSLMFFQDNSVLAAGNGVKGIDPLGFKLLGIFRSFAYWICIIMCIVEICKSLLQGDSKSIGKIVVKYVLAFAAIYLVPWLFDVIRDSF